MIFLDLQSYSSEYNITFQPMSSDISGIQDLHYNSSEYNIALQPTSSDISGIQDLQSRVKHYFPNNVKWHFWHTGLTIQSIILLSNQRQVIFLAYRTYNPTIQNIILLSNQRQVIFLAYRTYNLTVQSIILLSNQRSDISGIQDLQSYSPECKNSLQKQKPWKMDKLSNTVDKLFRIIAPMLYKRIY